MPRLAMVVAEPPAIATVSFSTTVQLAIHFGSTVGICRSCCFVCVTSHDGAKSIPHRLGVAEAAERTGRELRAVYRIDSRRIVRLSRT
jgi:hypothetical protein